MVERMSTCEKYDRLYTLQKDALTDLAGLVAPHVTERARPCPKRAGAPSLNGKLVKRATTDQPELRTNYNEHALVIQL